MRRRLWPGKAPPAAPRRPALDRHRAERL